MYCYPSLLNNSRNHVSRSLEHVPIKSLIFLPIYRCVNYIVAVHSWLTHSLSLGTCGHVRYRQFQSLAKIAIAVNETHLAMCTKSLSVLLA